MIIDVYRRGFNLGYAAGTEGRRRKARWELLLTTPLLWVPWLIATRSFIDGYKDGYLNGAKTTLYLSVARR